MPLSEKDRKFIQTHAFDNFEDAFQARRRMAKDLTAPLALYEVARRDGTTEYVLAPNETQVYANVGRRASEKIRRINSNLLRNYLRICATIKKLENALRRKQAFIERWENRRHEASQDILDALEVFELESDALVKAIAKNYGVMRLSARRIEHSYGAEIKPEDMESELLLTRKPSPPPIKKKTTDGT